MKRSFKRLIAIALTAVMTLGPATAAMADNAHFTFSNIDEEQPDLYVSKTVKSALEGYTAPDVDFTFVLKWDQDGDGNLEFADNVMYYVYNEDGSQVYNDANDSYIFRTNSTGRFTLKAGQCARFEWAGEVEYEVWEDENEYPDHFIQTLPAGGGEATGTVAEDGTMLYFENTYIPYIPEEEQTQLAVRKDISWPSGYEMPDFSEIKFTYEIKIDGEIYGDKPYTIYDSTMTDVLDTGYTERDGTFTLAGGQLALFDDIDVDVDYEITEVSMGEGWHATGKTYYGGSTTAPIVYVYFSNTDADFIVTKDRTDGAAGQEFKFILSDENDTPMDGVTYYIYDSDGNLTGSGTTGTDGEFAICAGERVIFTGILDGTKYKITEEKEDGYSVTSDNADDNSITDTEDYDEIDTHKFVNEQLTDITITKYGSRLNTERNKLGGVEFTIYKLKEGGDPDNEEDWEPYPNTDGAKNTTDSTKDSETYGMLTFTNLPAGTYRIVETKTPAGYITLGDAIEVTLPYTSKTEVTGAVYSERDGLYYIYGLSYTVDNTATLVMPNTGGWTWVIILCVIAGACAVGVAVRMYTKNHPRTRGVNGA